MPDKDSLRLTCERILMDRNYVAPATGNAPISLEYWSKHSPWSVAELEAELQAMVTEANAWRQD